MTSSSLARLRLKVHAAQLATRGDAELSKNVRQVKPDSPRAQEELCSDVPIAQALRSETRDVQLLWRELVDRRLVSSGERDSRRTQLGPRSLHPRVSTQLIEHLQGDPQLPSGLGLEALPAEPLSVLEPGLRELERVGVLAGNGNRRLEFGR